MGRLAKSSERLEFTRMLDRMGDEKVRYFYLMLGDALAEALSPKAGNHDLRANTGPDHIADIGSRLNKA